MKIYKLYGLKRFFMKDIYKFMKDIIYHVNFY